MDWLSLDFLHVWDLTSNLSHSVRYPSLEAKCNPNSRLETGNAFWFLSYWFFRSAFSGSSVRFYQSRQLFLLQRFGLNVLYRLVLCLEWEEARGHILSRPGKAQPPPVWVAGTLKTKSQVNICSQEKEALHTFAFIWECSFSWMNFVFNTLLPRGRFLLFVFSEVPSSGSEWWVHMNPPLSVFPQARKLSAPLKPD